ncbi:MAG: methionine--tRNA ligase [Candidatus Kaelpia aquatica]|nr:methionine--tRNA ligase [Candidatus Kaelpia aquatica]
MKNKKFCITTPIYYINGEPHIGHAYTNVAADVLARYMRMRGESVYFLTGTDEHGQKIEKAAGESGEDDVKVFCDSIVSKFIGLWDILNISYDDFIRTTEFRHEETVKNILSFLYKEGYIYESNYEGWYCMPCETFWIESQVENKICPDCGRELEFITEKNYFLKVSEYRDWLRGYLEDNKDFILPQSRFNEVISFLENPLTDLCISRPKERVSWGITLPFDDNYITYVWFEALLNYITAPGFLREDDSFKSIWPADVQFMAKDILRYHAVYWPIMLHMLGLELPAMVFSHGWWLIEREEGIDKMSKSKGNVVDPRELIDRYSTDALRYFLLREVPFGMDGNFSESSFIKRVNSDLANDFGNLVFRTLNMIVKYYDGIIPESKKAVNSCDEFFSFKIASIYEKIEESMKVVNYHNVLEVIWELISAANKYIEVKAPWKLKKEDPDELAYVIYTLSDVIRIVLIALTPFIPESTQKAWSYFGYKDKVKEHDYSEISSWGKVPFNQVVEKGEPLFPRIEVEDQ